MHAVSWSKTAVNLKRAAKDNKEVKRRSWNKRQTVRGRKMIKRKGFKSTMCII